MVKIESMRGVIQKVKFLSWLDFLFFIFFIFQSLAQKYLGLLSSNVFKSLITLEATDEQHWSQPNGVKPRNLLLMTLDRVLATQQDDSFSDKSSAAQICI